MNEKFITLVAPPQFKVGAANSIMFMPITVACDS